MKLTQARYEAFSRLGKEIDNRVDRACNLYNQLLKDAGIPLSDGILWHNGTTYLDYLDDGIDINWETSWAYGGHDSGTNLIPMECLIDNTWEEEIMKRAKETISKYRSDERAKAKQSRDSERKEYKRLKTKFELSNEEKEND